MPLSAAPSARVAAAERRNVRSVDQSNDDDVLKVRFVPSVVKPEAPPNAEELLYCSCVLEPPGVPPPPPPIAAHVVAPSVLV